MLRSKPFTLLSLLFSLNTSAQTRVVLDDITHFWDAYDRVTATKDTAEQRRLLHTYFIQRATAGQKAMFEARRYTPDEYLQAIRSYPRYYASIRPNMLRASEHAEAMRAGAERLRKIHPTMRPADIHFTVGVFRSGGTVMNGMVLIGSEISLADSTTDTSEFPPELTHLGTFFATNPARELAFTNVHELIHTQQPARWGYDLLSQSLFEGIAEFIPTLAMERPSPSGSVIYGEAHADTVRKVFEQELFAYWIDRWIWNDLSGPFPQRDLGYYVGYAMARSYYERSTDKRRAIADLIGLNCEDRAAVEAFADGCGYLSRPVAELRAAFEAQRPRVIGLEGFNNGSTDVDPARNTITVLFDRPMHTGFRSLGLGELGKDHLPEIMDQAFAHDGRSITYTVKLEAGKRYQMVLEEGFRDPRLFQMVPYTVDFATR
ncbi:MAG TPA: hypothetical protein VGE21_08675 [Flavobacteriales bacterium]